MLIITCGIKSEELLRTPSNVENVLFDKVSDFASIVEPINGQNDLSEFNSPHKSKPVIRSVQETNENLLDDPSNNFEKQEKNVPYEDLQPQKIYEDEIEDDNMYNKRRRKRLRTGGFLKGSVVIPYSGLRKRSPFFENARERRKRLINYSRQRNLDTWNRMRYERENVPGKKLYYSLPNLDELARHDDFLKMRNYAATYIIIPTNIMKYARLKSSGEYNEVNRVTVPHKKMVERTTNRAVMHKFATVKREFESEFEPRLYFTPSYLNGYPGEYTTSTTRGPYSSYERYLASKIVHNIVPKVYNIHKPANENMIYDNLPAKRQPIVKHHKRTTANTDDFSWENSFLKVLTLNSGEEESKSSTGKAAVMTINNSKRGSKEEPKRKVRRSVDKNDQNNMNNLEPNLELNNKLSDELTSNLNDASILKDDVNGVKDDVSNVKDDVSNIQGDVNSLKNIEGDVKFENGVNEDVSNAKEDASKEKSEVSNINDGAGIVKDEISNVKQLNNIKDNINNVKEEAGVVKEDVNIDKSVNNMNDDMSNAKENVSNNRESINNIKETESNVKESVSNLKDSISNAKDDVNNLKDGEQNKMRKAEHNVKIEKKEEIGCGGGTINSVQIEKPNKTTDVDDDDDDDNDGCGDLKEETTTNKASQSQKEDSNEEDIGCDPGYKGHNVQSSNKPELYSQVDESQLISGLGITSSNIVHVESLGGGLQQSIGGGCDSSGGLKEKSTEQNNLHIADEGCGGEMNSEENKQQTGEGRSEVNSENLGEQKGETCEQQKGEEPEKQHGENDENGEQEPCGGGEEKGEEEMKGPCGGGEGQEENGKGEGEKSEEEQKGEEEGQGEKGEGQEAPGKQGKPKICFTKETTVSGTGRENEETVELTSLTTGTVSSNGSSTVSREGSSSISSEGSSSTSSEGSTISSSIKTTELTTTETSTQTNEQTSTSQTTEGSTVLTSLSTTPMTTQTQTSEPGEEESTTEISGIYHTIRVTEVFRGLEIVATAGIRVDTIPERPPLDQDLGIQSNTSSNLDDAGCSAKRSPAKKTRSKR